MQCFYGAYWVSTSSKIAAIITKSSAYHISQGRVILRSLKRASRTIRNNKGPKQNPDKSLPSHQTSFSQYCLLWSHCRCSYTLSSEPLLTIHWHQTFSYGDPIKCFFQIHKDKKEFLLFYRYLSWRWRAINVLSNSAFNRHETKLYCVYVNQI